MNVKIDTREKFHVITLLDSILTGNMTEELRSVLDKIREKDPRNIILNLSSVEQLDDQSAAFLTAAQQKSYEQQHSFVLCCLQGGVEDWLDNKQVLELLNTTPTESEAWDIVQMEEVERELGDF